MAKSTKIQDFRKINTSQKETTPTKKKGMESVSVSNKKEKKNISVLPFFLIILVFIGIGIGCMLTPAFNVTTIKVENGINVTNEEILSKASYVKGVNTLKINTKNLKKTIEEIPYIQTVKIKRNLPDELVIKYEERAPYAIIKYLESYVIMDKYGYVLEIKKENDMKDLTIIYGVDAEEYIPGNVLDGGARLKYENTAYLLEGAKQVNFGYKISEINYQDPENVIISVVDEDADMEIEVEYGNIEREILSEKISYVNEMLKIIEYKRGVLSINKEDYNNESIFKIKY